MELENLGFDTSKNKKPLKSKANLKTHGGEQERLRCPNNHPMWNLYPTGRKVDNRPEIACRACEKEHENA